MKIEKAILPLIGCLIVTAILIACTPHPAPGPGTAFPRNSEASPTSLPSPTATATATPRPTDTLVPTPTPDLYAVDEAKLFNNMPSNADDFAAGVASGRFVRSPSPISDKPAFDKWLTEKLNPALGDSTMLEANILINYSAQGSWDLTFTFEGIQPQPLLSPPEFFYFTENGMNYPVVILSILDSQVEGRKSDPCALILINNIDGSPLNNVLADLSSGKTIIDVVLYNSSSSRFGPVVNTMITSGLVWGNSSGGTHVVVGTIWSK